MKQGLIRRIGNGATTEIWVDNWLPRDTMPRPLLSRVAEPPQLVQELIDSTAAVWREDRIREVFLPMGADSILSIPFVHETYE